MINLAPRKISTAVAEQIIAHRRKVCRNFARAIKNITLTAIAPSIYIFAVCMKSLAYLAPRPANMS